MNDKPTDLKDEELRKTILSQAGSDEQSAGSEDNTIIGAYIEGNSPPQAADAREDVTTVINLTLTEAEQRARASEAHLPDPLIDTIIGGHYRVLEKIGEGGMGKVYRAIHTLLNRAVAIKILDHRIGNSEQEIRRFKQEAKAASDFTHPNIPSIREFGVDGNIPFIVMDFVDGNTLSTLINRAEGKGMNPQLVCKIAEQVCAALEHAHEKKVVHRDIKPSNIMVSFDESEPKAYLLDFGIAKVMDSINDPRLTTTGEVVGTVMYMSPEQFQGLPATPATDIYSLGCVLFEALNGKPPFASSNRMEIIMKHQNTEPPDMPKSVPKSIQRLVYRCLAKSPERRYSRASELRAHLNRILSGDDTPIVIPRVKSSWKRIALTILLTVPCLLGTYQILVATRHQNVNTLNKEIVANPKNASLYFERGRKYYEERHYKESLSDFLRAAKLDPKNSRAFYWASRVYFNEGDFDKTLEYINRALELNPTYREAIAARAAVKSKQGFLKESNEDYTKLLSLMPANDRSDTKLACLTNRSNNYHLMGMEKEALADAQSALEISPDDLDARLCRAEVWLSYGNTEMLMKALDDVEAALQVDGKSTRAIADRGRIFLRQKKYKDASDDLSEAILLGRTRLPIYMDRAKALFAQGLARPALADIETAMKMDPENPLPPVYKAYYELRLGQVKEALADIAKADSLSKEPLHLSSLVKAAALAQEGKSEEAKALLESIKKTVDLNYVDAEVLEFAENTVYKRK